MSTQTSEFPGQFSEDLFGDAERAYCGASPEDRPGLLLEYGNRLSGYRDWPLFAGILAQECGGYSESEVRQMLHLKRGYLPGGVE